MIDKITDLQRASADHGTRIASIEETLERHLQSIDSRVTTAITAAVKSAITLSTEEQEWVRLSVLSKKQSVEFRNKVIQSSILWAIPLVFAAILTVCREYMINHGMWKP